MPQPKQGSEVRKQGKGFSIRAEAGRAEILLYDVIDPWYGISAKDFHAQLKALGEVTALDVRINSPGGSITEGMAIHSILKRHTAKVTAHVDGIAASMASVVAMAADEIVMAAGSYMMIHNPIGVMIGEADEMREYAELLDKMKGQLVNLYAGRTKQSAEAIIALMDDETWFTANEAVANGFADRTSAELALAASLDLSRFTHVPQKLRGEAQMSTATPVSDQANQAAPPALPLAAGYDELKAECLGADAAFLCSQLEKKATLPQARAAWMTEQQARLTAAQAETQQAKASTAANKMGVEPLGSGSGKTSATDGGDPIVAWNEALAQKLQAGYRQPRAIAALVREQPELHQQYLAAHNEQLRRAHNKS